MTPTDTERMLGAWFERAEPSREPADMLPAVFAVTHQMKQRRGIVGRFHAAIAEVREMTRINSSPAFVILVLTALLVAALVGIAIIGGGQPRQPGWRVLDRSEVPDTYTWVSQVSAGGPGLVAVGVTSGPADDACDRATRGRIWTSVDGDTWTDVGVDQFPDTRLEAVARAGEMVYAFGSVDASCDVGGNGSFTTWQSTNGATWERIGTSSAFDGSFISTLVEVGGVLLAPGTFQEPEPPDGSGLTQARVWTLSDGAWQQTASIDGVVISSVAAEGPRLVALGYSVPERLSDRRFCRERGRRPQLCSAPTVVLGAVSVRCGAGAMRRTVRSETARPETRRSTFASLP